MRNDMGMLLFKGSGFKAIKARKRFAGKALVTKAAQPLVETMNFRLGDEPEGYKVRRYLGVRHANLNGGWVTAEMVRCVEDEVTDTTMEDVATREPMRGLRSRYEDKDSKLNLSVLKRFVGARVGRNWGLVLGEIRRGCDGRSYQGYTLEQCLGYFVVTNVDLIGDQLWDVEFCCRLEESPQRYRFFVHPITGLLQHLPRLTNSDKLDKAKANEAKRPEQVDIDALTKLVRIAGIWYVVSFRPIPTLEEVSNNQPYDRKGEQAETFWQNLLGVEVKVTKNPPVVPKDVVLGYPAVNDPASNYRTYVGNKVGNYAVDTLRQAWGAEIYAVSKRQAGRQEIKRHIRVA